VAYSGDRRATGGGFPFFLRKVVRDMNERRQHESDGRAYAWLICLVIFLSYMLVYFHRLCPSVLALEMQRDFAVSGTLLAHRRRKAAPF
jgi:sugar phosphate permease